MLAAGRGYNIAVEIKTLDSNRAHFVSHFADLSDEALQSVKREDLVEAARECLDQELASRNLPTSLDLETAKPSSEDDAAPGIDLVPLDTYEISEEAKLARALLESADIPCYLTYAHTVGTTSLWTNAPGLTLMVPAALLDEAREILGAQITDEELDAQAEAAGESAPEQE
jgi:hypothetical protein